MYVHLLAPTCNRVLVPNLVLVPVSSCRVQTGAVDAQEILTTRYVTARFVGTIHAITYSIAPVHEHDVMIQVQIGIDSPT